MARLLDLLTERALKVSAEDIMRSTDSSGREHQIAGMKWNAGWIYPDHVLELSEKPIINSVKSNSWYIEAFPISISSQELSWDLRVHLGDVY